MDDVPAREDGVRAEKGAGGGKGVTAKINQARTKRLRRRFSFNCINFNPFIVSFFLGYRFVALAPFDRIHSTLFASFSATLAANRVRSLTRANNRRAQMERSKAHIISRKETERERKRSKEEARMKQKLVSLYKTIGGSSDGDVRTNGRSEESDREREYASNERAEKSQSNPIARILCMKFKNL